MRKLSELLDADDLLHLEPEELGGLLLELFNSGRDAFPGSLSECIHWYCGDSDLGASWPSNPAQRRFVERAIAEAWSWLERDGLLAPDPSQSQGSPRRFVTRRGQALKSRARVEEYRRAKVLPRELMHPSIREAAWSATLRGAYDSAVFEAFREVEVAVRAACGLSDTEIGVTLMRKAFHPDNGPLRDTGAPRAEQQALGDLFAGAIGSYKNPHSHRHVGIPSADEAAEMIILASHLLRIVESRR